ncbi:MAG TPA: SIMPL domain-containing protein [Candidatus Paceibacterota bacterium]|jgi:uncharacterized protein YggE|nr:SIMPL domain-containing protein [Candidatus Paceibacterota bacterium]
MWFEDIQVRRAVRVVLWLLVALMAAALIFVLSSLRYVGAGITPGNTISVSGYGESYSTPDIATFSFSVVSEKSTVAAAQSDATAKANATLAYLKSAGVADKDIQTSGYSINPQYDYMSTACVNGNCGSGRQVLRGYEVRQSTTVKVRDTSKAGDILAGIGDKGATEVSGLQFTFDDPQQGQVEARGKAITDAKSKANELAKELGVSIVRVVSFSESAGGTPTPMYAKLDMAAGSAVAQSAPDISVGQNKVTDNVSVTYEIR